MTFVLDASVTMAWFLNEPGPSLADIVDRLAEEGAVVPRIWPLEIANVFQMSIRRGRTSPSDRDAAFTELRQMPIAIDSDADDIAWTTIIGLSDEFRLTTYDATYLELARRRRLPLATTDKELKAAARRAGVEVLP